jgi:hypothetical protein
MFSIIKHSQLNKIIETLDNKPFNKEYVNKKINIIISKHNLEYYNKLNKIKSLLSNINIINYSYCFNDNIKKSFVIYVNNYNKYKKNITIREYNKINIIIEKLIEIRNNYKLKQLIINFFNILIKIFKLIISFLSILILKLIYKCTNWNISYYILKIVEFNGPVFIKILQHLLEYQKEIPFIKIFQVYKDDIRENINYHNNFYSNNIIKKYNLNIKLIDNFKKSGSMGQILKCKYENKICALKIIHPSLEREIYLTFLIIKWLTIFFKNILKIFCVKLYNIDINDLYEDMKIQSNLNNEAINYSKFKKNFEDYENIIFPEVYYHNKDLILYEFIDFPNQKTFPTEIKEKGIILYIISVYKMIFIDNFIHGDLHSGNWKIILDEQNKIKIVFFDTAIFFKIKKIEIFKKILYYDIIKDYDKLINYILEFLGINSSEITDKIKIKFKGQNIYKYEKFIDQLKSIYLIDHTLIYILNTLYSLRKYLRSIKKTWIDIIKQCNQYKYIELISIFNVYNIEIKDNLLIFTEEDRIIKIKNKNNITITNK